MSALKVSVLTVGNKTINSLGLINPLVKNRHLFREIGISIYTTSDHCSGITESDILILDSKYFKDKWKTDHDRALADIDRLKSKKSKLCWFDTGDSTGVIQAQVLPIVDQYLKAQSLKDRHKYRKKYYGGRIHTDYYHELESITDSKPEYSQSVGDAGSKKIQTAWNYGLAGGYGTVGNIFGRARAHMTGKIYHPRNNRYSKLGKNKKLELFIRMNLNYQRETVAYQRKRVIEQLQRRANQGTINKRQYLEEIRNSKVIVSPFGWGEINIRDFECFVSGGILLKPSMSHLVTFPNYYLEDRTYIPINWDLLDLASKVEELIECYSDFVEIGLEGQRMFKYFDEDVCGRKEFVKYVEALFQGRTIDGQITT